LKSLGIDVSARRGLDLVLIEAPPSRIGRCKPHVTLEALSGIIQEWRPDVVAIDSPPAFGRAGGARLAERELLRLGIHSYGTPSDPDKLRATFYDWMRVGFEVFERCDGLGYGRYSGGAAVEGAAAEVFPHASAVVLSGGLPPLGVGKQAFRRAALERHGVTSSSLGSLDLVDAALAALTGLFALRGECSTVGDPDEGVILLPGPRPEAPFRRCPTSPPEAESQRHLPRLAACACGDPTCRALTDREFAPGHDAKRKSLLWKQARLGQEALEELHRRAWEIPPELR
jgi:predicted nuclease with RNAse H fold